MVAERADGDAEDIALGGREVAAEIGHPEAAPPGGVVMKGTDVEVLVVEEDTDDAGEVGRPDEVRPDAHEVADGGGRGPGGIVEPAVQHDRTGGAPRDGVAARLVAGDGDGIDHLRREAQRPEAEDGGDEAWSARHEGRGEEDREAV